MFLFCFALLTFALLYTRAKVQPDTVVERFYETWMVAAASDRNAPVAQGLHTKSVYVTEGFREDIAREAGKGRDAVLCGLPVPFTVEIDDVRVNKARTTANVFMRAGDQELMVHLQRDNLKWWRINEVDCPDIEMPDVEGSTSTPDIVIEQVSQ